MQNPKSFDFDAPVDRRSTAALKWDRYAGRDVIPMWVADMDFRSPPAVIEAIRRRVDHGVFGYTDPPASLIASIIEHLDATYGWRVEPQWLLWLPGLVTGINLVCRAIGGEGDEVVTATPVYHPFLSGPVNQNRSVLRVPMQLQREQWAWDMPALRKAITARTQLLMLCNPHNPVGRVLTLEELMQVAEVARERDLVVCSDEIHCGLILEDGCRHIPFATISADAASRTITLMSASKTFNLPALGCAFAIVANPTLRAKLERAGAGILPRVNALGYAATEAAYRHGEPWRRALVDYLRLNRDRVLARIGGIPRLRASPIEATYLAWIDTRETGPDDPVAAFEKAGVGLYDGKAFGGPGYVRLNFACPRALLERALDRIEAALA